MPAPRRALDPRGARDEIERRFLAPTSARRVGLETEWLVVGPDPEAHPSHAEVRQSVEAAARPPGGASITWEPGGQLELSGPSSADVDTACRTMAADHDAMAKALEPLDVRLVAAGLDARSQRRVVDSPRYRAMEAYFSARGAEGRTMMCASAALQVNLDAGVGSWQLAHAIGPTMVAAFANSPARGWVSARSRNWWAIDPARTAPVVGRDARLATRSNHHSWSRYVLDAPVMFICAERDRFVVPTPALTFGRWLVNGHELGWPTADDLACHLTTLFPPVRPRGWLEIRYLDALADPWWRVAAGVATALLHDEEASQRAGDATRGTTAMWHEAARYGLGHPALAASARACFTAALDALVRVGAGPTLVAECESYVERFVERGRCPADEVPIGAAAWT